MRHHAGRPLVIRWESIHPWYHISSSNSLNERKRRRQGEQRKTSIEHHSEKIGHYLPKPSLTTSLRSPWNKVGFHLLSRRVVVDQQVRSLGWQVRQQVGARQGNKSLLELRGSDDLGDGREIIAVGDKIEEPG